MKARVYMLIASVLASSVFFLTLNRATLKNDSGSQVLGEEIILIEDQSLVGKNALDALEQVASENNLELKVKEFDFGTMIEGIGGRENSEEKSWIYFVNGAAGSVAADQYILKAGDKLEWKYIKPEF